MQTSYWGLGPCGAGLSNQPEATGLRWSGTLEEGGKRRQHMLDNSSEKVGVQSGTAEEKGSTHSYCVFD